MRSQRRLAVQDPLTIGALAAAAQPENESRLWGGRPERDGVPHGWWRWHGHGRTRCLGDVVCTRYRNGLILFTSPSGLVLGEVTVVPEWTGRLGKLDGATVADAFAGSNGRITGPTHGPVTRRPLTQQAVSEVISSATVSVPAFRTDLCDSRVRGGAGTSSRLGVSRGGVSVPWLRTPSTLLLPRSSGSFSDRCYGNTLPGPGWHRSHPTTRGRLQQHHAGVSDRADTLTVDAQTGTGRAIAGSNVTVADSLLVVARGLQLAAALETALRERESAGVTAIGTSSADLLHGPIAAVQPGSAVLLVDGDPATAADLRDLGARMVDPDVPAGLLTVTRTKPRSADDLELMTAGWDAKGPRTLGRSGLSRT